MPDPDNTFPIPPLSPKADGASPTSPPVPPQPAAVPPGPMPSNDWVAPVQPVANTAPNPVVPPATPTIAMAPTPVEPVAAPASMPPVQQPALPQEPTIPQPSIAVDDGLGAPPPGAPMATQPVPVAAAVVQQPVPPADATVPMPVDASTVPTNMLDLSASAGLPSQPAPPVGMSPSNTGLPTDMNTDLMSADAAMLGTDIATEQPKRSKLKIVIIVGLVFVGLVLILSLVLYLTGRSSRKPAIELNEQQSSEQTQTTQPTTDANAPAAIPDGFVKITRDCYSFGFPADNTIPPADKSCSLSTKIGKLGLGTVNIVPGTNVVNNLDDLLAVAKSSNKVLSEEDTKINGVAAKKLVVEGASGQSVKYLVIVKDKGYTFSGKPVQSFDINFSTSQDFFKKVADTAISTWQWATTAPAAPTTP